MRLFCLTLAGCFLALCFANTSSTQQVVVRRPIPSATATPTPSPEPDDISGLVFWGEARFEAYSNNDAVGTFNDQSGANNDATSSGTDRPTFKTNQINGHAAIYWDGGVHFFTFPNILNGSSAGEIYLVIKLDNDPPTGGDFGLWDFSSSDANTAWPYTDGNIYDNWGTTVRKSPANPSPALTSFNLYNVWSASGDWASLINGSALQSSASNTVTFRTAPILGKSGDGSTLAGYIACVIIYNKKLNSTERGQVKTYITNTYGLSLS